jgi:hypothetical protein
MIHSNVDLHEIPDDERKRHERIERGTEFAKQAYAKADKAEREQGVESPGIVHWFQQEGYYTADPRLDNDPTFIRDNFTSLPVKERVIEHDGTDVATLSPAAFEAVRLGYFCGRCEERQPEDHVIRRENFNRLQAMGAALPAHATPSDNCCYCGNRLGINGEYEHPSLNDAQVEAAVAETMREFELMEVAPDTQGWADLTEGL